MSFDFFFSFFSSCQAQLSSRYQLKPQPQQVVTLTVAKLKMKSQCQRSLELSLSGVFDESLCITMLIPCTKGLGCGRQEVGFVSTSVPVVADQPLLRDDMLSCL